MVCIGIGQCVNTGVNSGVNGAHGHKVAWRINGLNLAFYTWASCKPEF